MKSVSVLVSFCFPQTDRLLCQFIRKKVPHCKVKTKVKTEKSGMNCGDCPGYHYGRKNSDDRIQRVECKAWYHDEVDEGNPEVWFVQLS